MCVFVHCACVFECVRVFVCICVCVCVCVCCVWSTHNNSIKRHLTGQLSTHLLVHGEVS